LSTLSDTTTVLSSGDTANDPTSSGRSVTWVRAPVATSTLNTWLTPPARLEAK
jgi:hypothetical protein